MQVIKLNSCVKVSRLEYLLIEAGISFISRIVSSKKSGIQFVISILGR